MGALLAGRPASALAAGATALLAFSEPAVACRLAMTIGMDVSASIDDREHALQREGLARALVDPDVVDAFLATDPIELQVFEWSGRARQTVILDWIPIIGEGDLIEAAAVLRVAPRADREFPTAIGAALVFASMQIGRVVHCAEYMVNLSGDGENNDGIQPRMAVREFGHEPLTINGLVVGGSLERLRRYYEQHVIHGPASFVEVATGFEDFADAMRRKLIRELGPIAEADGS